MTPSVFAARVTSTHPHLDFELGDVFVVVELGKPCFRAYERYSAQMVLGPCSRRSIPFVGLVALADPEFAFGRRLEHRPLFNVLVWICAIGSGFAVAWLTWRRLLGRGKMMMMRAGVAMIAALAVAVIARPGTEPNTR